MVVKTVGKIRDRPTYNTACFDDDVTRKLDLGADQAKIYSGKVNKSFVVTAAFKFLPV